MNFYTKFVTAILFPLHEKVKGHSTTAVHKAMDKSQWLTPAQLQQLQVDNLKAFLNDVQAHVPYYQNLFQDLKFDPGSIRSVADLHQLPLLGKPEIRKFTEQMKADNAPNLQRFNTGGSSGEPLIFYLDTERVSHDVAAKRRATRWWGVDIGDRELVVWGSPIELGSQDRLRQARDFLFRTELLSAFEMSDENLDKFVNSIISAKPKMLFGYPSSLALIAEYADKKGYTLTNLGIEVAFVTSERLYDHQRAQIEKTFACPVANGYGGRDAGFIAHECPAGSMHITSEDIVVEIVDDSGNPVPVGERGEIVVTHMRTRGFPFVRYKTGDVGVLDSSACSCGRGLPVLKEIEGRTTDFIRTIDGQVLHGLSLIYVLRDIPEVKLFRIIQESLESIVVQVVAPDAEKQELEQTIVGQFERRLGASISIEVEYHSEIPREGSGKFRYVVSKVH